MGSGTVEVGTGGIGTRFIKEDWPVVEGTDAGTTKTHGRKMELEPEGLVDNISIKFSSVPEKDKELL